MREYKIFKTDMGWSIYRKKNIGKLIMMQFLNGHDQWTTNKGAAKTFYHRDDAVGALVIIKQRDEKKSD